MSKNMLFVVIALSLLVLAQIACSDVNGDGMHIPDGCKPGQAQLADGTSCVPGEAQKQQAQKNIQAVQQGIQDVPGVKQVQDYNAQQNNVVVGNALGIVKDAKTSVDSSTGGQAVKALDNNHGCPPTDSWMQDKNGNWGCY